MAKKAKSSSKREKVRERTERRFEPLPISSPSVVYAVGAVGAALMGAGAWGQFGGLIHDGGPEPFKFAPYVLAFGAVLVGVAIWIGTNGDAAIRVGDGGLGVDKGTVRRMPWYAVERVTWTDAGLRVTGNDEFGTAMPFTVSLRSHPQAVAWIVEQARARVPTAVEVPEGAPVPALLAGAGSVRPLEAPQVVGKHCAISGKVIAYEPDARLCPRCERVYHKAHVPEACECGESLAELRPAPQTTPASA